MKKRKIAVLLALTLTAASVIGGCNKEKETEKVTETAKQTETPAATEAPTEKPTEKATEKKESETNKPGESESNQQTESNPQSESGNSTGGTQSTEGGQDTQGEAPITTSGSDEADTKRWFFDKNGNTVYANKNSEGKWLGDDGVAFYFYEDGVEDSNGAKYYYDLTEISSGTPEASSAGTESSDTSDGDADYYDFYDTDGNYIVATQNEAGEWVDDNGNKYIFGAEGVTDSNGNFHPY